MVDPNTGGLAAGNWSGVLNWDPQSQKWSTFGAPGGQFVFADEGLIAEGAYPIAFCDLPQ
jgi:hypothetical protein